MADSSTLVDRVKIFVESSGTGPFQLGNALPAFRGSEALVDGLTYSYAVESGSDYEVGRGVYVLAVDQLLREPTLSSNGGAPVAFPANVAVNFTALAADLVAGLAGSGTVTSVQASGGSTGLEFTGGPITGFGTLVMGGVLSVANGGTGGADAASARTGIGLGNVNNTSDANKPISLAMQEFIDHLASSDGAGDVGFIQTGLDAEPDNLSDRAKRTKQALDFVPNVLRAGVMDGTNATVLTAYVQAAVEATPAGWTLEFQGDGWIMGLVNIEQSIRLAGPATIALSGSGARFRFNANFDKFVADNLTIVGSGVAADDHYGFAPTTSSVVVQNATFNNIIIRNTVNGIDCSAMVNFRVTGGKIGPTVPAGSPGPGQGYGIAGGTNSKIGSVWGTHFYRCSRHSVYFGHLNSGTVVGCTFEEHAYGATPTLGQLAALSMARGQGNTAIANHFLNCVTCPVEISDESSLSGHAINFTVASNEFRGCSQPCTIGGTGAAGTDNGTDAVIWSGNNHYMPAGATECVRIFQGTGLSVRGNQFLFQPSDVAATAITVDDTATDQPTQLAIAGNSMFSTPSSGTSQLVYLDSGVCGSGSNAAIRVRNNELFGTAKMFTAATTLQNANVRTDTTDRLALSSGATPSVAGYSQLEMSYGSATNVTDFLYSFEGQTIELYFTNGNVTLKNTNFYLAGGVDFTGSAADVLVMKRISGAWREVSRSVN